MKTEDFINLVMMYMSSTLNREQLDKLHDVLIEMLHNIELVEKCTDIVVGALSNNEIKIRMFAASKLAVNRSPATIKQYVREIRKVLQAINKDAENISTMDIRWYYTQLRQEGKISAVTMKTRLTYLSTFYDFLVNEGVVTKNPVKSIGAVSVEKIIKDPFTAEELEKLRLGCDNDRDRAIVEFLYSTGVRISEMVALNVEDIDFKNKELVVYGKGSKERHTYLTDTAIFYLNTYLNTRKDEENLLLNPLFVTNRKPYKRVTKSGIEYMLKTLGKKVGVENVHPHRFRRTIATDLLNRGMPIEEVKDFLGHEKIETTLIYAKTKQENVQTSHHRFA